MSQQIQRQPSRSNKPRPLTKPEMQERISSLKRWIIGGSVVGFLGVGGLIVNQQINPTNTSSSSSNNQQNGGFFSQPGGGSVSGGTQTQSNTGSGGS